jgi:hypothetical protein
MTSLDPVGALRKKKLDLARVDPRSGMPIQPPRGASPQALAAVERAMRRPLPPSYRAFLREHDGWPSLFDGMSLLSSRQLSRGAYVDLARVMLEDGAFETSSLFAIGIDPEAQTIAAFDLSEVREDGEIPIIVFFGGIGERVGTFDELLSLFGELFDAEITTRRAEARARAAA